MGSLNRKGSVSSSFSLKRSVIKPLPYNQYTNTSAGCVIPIWAWGCNVVCVRFPLSFWISYRAESHGTDGTKHVCRSKTGTTFKCQICLNISRFPYRMCLDCNGAMGKPPNKWRTQAAEEGGRRNKGLRILSEDKNALLSRFVRTRI